MFFADFGLFLPDEFDLTDAARSFLTEHRYFDIGEFIASLDWPTPNQHVEHSAAYKESLTPYRALIDEMPGFFGRLSAGPKTNGEYHDSNVADLLTDTM